MVYFAVRSAEDGSGRSDWSIQPIREAEDDQGGRLVELRHKPVACLFDRSLFRPAVCPARFGRRLGYGLKGDRSSLLFPVLNPRPKWQDNADKSQPTVEGRVWPAQTGTAPQGRAEAGIGCLLLLRWREGRKAGDQPMLPSLNGYKIRY